MKNRTNRNVGYSMLAVLSLAAGLPAALQAENGGSAWGVCVEPLGQPAYLPGGQRIKPGVFSARYQRMWTDYQLMRYQAMMQESQVVYAAEPPAPAKVEMNKPAVVVETTSVAAPAEVLAEPKPKTTWRSLLGRKNRTEIMPLPAESMTVPNKPESVAIIETKPMSNSSTPKPVEMVTPETSVPKRSILQRLFGPKVKTTAQSETIVDSSGAVIIDETATRRDALSDTTSKEMIILPKTPAKK